MMSRAHPLPAAILLSVLWLTGGAANAADLTPVRSVAPNGLTVLVLEQHALPIVQIDALVRVGSAQDPTKPCCVYIDGCYKSGIF